MIGQQSETRRKFLKFGGAALASNLWTFGPHSAVAIDLHGHGPDIQPWTSSNPALSGAFEPVFDERDDADLKVEGEIPRGLRGVFMRNGPNPQYKPDDHYAYPFDGTGMVHAIYIENGRARYRNRWVMTKEMQQEREAGQRIFNASFSAPPHADLANTNIIHHAGRYLALYEAGVPYELDRDLNTLGLFNYEGKLPSVMSAHPKLDPNTGELLSVAYNAKTGALTYLRANKQGQLDTVVPFRGPWGTLVHDIFCCRSEGGQLHAPGWGLSAQVIPNLIPVLTDQFRKRLQKRKIGFARTVLIHGDGLIRVRGEEELPDGALVTRYAFAHALYQNVFYEEIVGARRTQLHALAGEQLLKHYGDLAPRIAGQLAMHFERGRNWVRTVEFLMLAAANARNMYANSEAEEHYTHAIQVSARLPESARAEAQLRIYEKRAAVYLATSRFDLSIADSREMIQRARAAGSTELECAALYTLGNTLFWAHRLDEMQSTFEDFLRVSAANESGRLRALALIAQGHLAAGDLALAEDKLRTLIQCSLSLDKKTLLDSLDVRARLSFFRSEYEDAEHMFRKQIELSLELGDAFEFMKANYFLGLTLANLGRVSEAFATLGGAVDIAKRNGELFWLSRIPNAFGWIHREMQDFKAAQAFDREGAAIAHEAGFGEAEVNSVINVAMDHLQSNDQATACSAMKTAASLLSHDAWFRWRFEIRFLHARAEQTLAKIDAIALLERAIQYDARKYIVIARTLVSRIAMLSSDFDTAAKEIKAACAMLKRYPALLCSWRANAMLGRIEMQLGNPDAGLMAYRLAVSNIRYIADHIDETRLRTTFLSSNAIRDVLRHAGERACTA